LEGWKVGRWEGGKVGRLLVNGYQLKACPAIGGVKS